MSDLFHQREILREREVKLVLEFNNDAPIDLLDFTNALTAIALEHTAAIQNARQGISPEDTRLLLLDVRKGSIIMELVSLTTMFLSQAETINTSVDFVKNLSSWASALRNPGGRMPVPEGQPHSVTVKHINNFQKIAKPVMDDPNGRFSLYAKLQEGNALSEFVLTREAASTSYQNLEDQRRELDQTESRVHKKVIMRLHQLSADSLKTGKKSSEKGIIEQVDMIPRTLIYVSELAGQRIKEEITNSDGNTLKKVFVVDVNVETIDGKPKAYRIINLHDIIDLDDDGEV